MGSSKAARGETEKREGRMENGDERIEEGRNGNVR